MPEIPIYTAGNLDRQRIAGAPDIPVDPRFRAGSALGDSVVKAAQSTIEHFGRIKQMREELQSVDAAQKFEAGIKNIHQELEFDKDVIDKPESYMAAFHKKAMDFKGQIDEEIKGQGENVVNAFGNYFDRRYPSELIDAKARGLKLGVMDVVARLDEKKFSLAEQASKADGPVQRDIFNGMYYSAVDEAEKGGFITKDEAVKRRQDYRVHTESAYMNVVGRVNPDMMFMLEGMGAFDNVPELQRQSIIDRTIKIQQAKATADRTRLEAARKEFAEKTEREAETLIGQRKMNREFIEQRKDYVNSEKVKAWETSLRHQEQGIGIGNPIVERALSADVYNPGIDPRQTYSTLSRLYAAGQVGRENYEVWAPHLGVLIQRKIDQAKSDQKEGETRVREIQAHRFTTASENIERALGTRSAFEKFDEISHEAKAQFHEELQQNVDYLGGKEDAMQRYHRLLPKYVARVQERSTSRLKGLKQTIGGYSTEDQITADRGKLGEEQYYGKLRAIREYRYIWNEVQQLQQLGAISKQAQDTGERQ